MLVLALSLCGANHDTRYHAALHKWLMHTYNVHYIHILLNHLYNESSNQVTLQNIASIFKYYFSTIKYKRDYTRQLFIQ